MQSEILVAELSEINFDSFMQDDHSTDPDKNKLSAYIKEENFNQGQLDAIIKKYNVSYSQFLIADKNWNEKWESEFDPVIINYYVAIRAAFHKPVSTVKHEIIITPKMSFGTGHHATTWLILQTMQELDFKNKSVLDIGTGTGVLSILATKSGAKNVTAIDNDEWSFNNAKENFTQNNCSEIELIKKDTLKDLPKFDIVLANINLQFFRSYTEDIKNVCNDNAQLIISGFLEEDEKIILPIFEKNEFDLQHKKNKNGWSCLLYRINKMV